MGCSSGNENGKGQQTSREPTAHTGQDLGGALSSVFSVEHCPALPLLLEAFELAQEVRTSVWDFAVEIKELRKAGVTNSRLRWLAWKGLVEHAREKKPAEGGRRVFQQGGRLTFTDKTCFVLTSTGADLARSLLGGKEQISANPSPVESNNSPMDVGGTAPAGKPEDRLVPSWDCERQELRLGTRVVKQFKVPAPNQERVLAAFEEEGWPVRIDDPLPPNPDNPEQDRKRRLHDTIGSLNRNQKRRLVRFVGDGSGEGVRWELVPPSDEDGRGSSV